MCVSGIGIGGVAGFRGVEESRGDGRKWNRQGGKGRRLRDSEAEGSGSFFLGRRGVGED